jgi:hypothetical protein
LLFTEVKPNSSASGGGLEYLHCRLASRSRGRNGNAGAGGHNWATLSLRYIDTEAWASMLRVGSKAEHHAL